MSDDFEKRMREKAEALLVAKTTETAMARPRTGAERLKLKQQLARSKRTRRRRNAERKRLLKVPKIDRRKKGQGVTLAERLLARTEPDVWYYFRQLRALLPEASKGSVKFVVYQQVLDRGWLERRAVVENPQAQWLNCDGDTKRKLVDGRYASQVATIAPRYIYRIGAQQGAERARARERLLALSSDGLE